MPHKIMIVDDEPANLRLLERLFRRDHQVLTAQSGAEALSLLEQHNVALLITDQRMPGMTGLELVERTSALRPHMIRIVLSGYTDVTTLVEAINSGHVYKFVTKPWNNDELRLTVSRALEFYEGERKRHELTLANERLARRLQQTTHGFVRAIADALEAKDEYTHGHARRVSGFAVSIGRRMSLDDEALDQLSVAAFLHDIGKIGTPDEVLLKPSGLTDEERLVIQQHSERGARMLAGVPDMEDIAAAVRHHHENFDGTGYPTGLSGAQIPLGASIIRVADAYDAMTSPRPFRDALSHEEAMLRIEELSGTHFDPVVVRAFKNLEALGEIRTALAGGFDTPAGPLLCALTPRTLRAAELTFDQLVSETEVEPVLAAAVLREANLGQAEEPPTLNLAAAAGRLGEARLREIVERSCAPQRPENAQAEELRERSVRAAVAARILAERTAIADRNEAYTLGLLHKVGEILIRSLFPEQMEQGGRLTQEAQHEREVVRFGVDHAQVGQWVLEACGVPRRRAAVVQTRADVERMNDPLTLLLHVANAIAHRDEASKKEVLDRIGRNRLQMLGLSSADLAGIDARVNELTEPQLAGFAQV